MTNLDTLAVSEDIAASDMDIIKSIDMHIEDPDAYDPELDCMLEPEFEAEDLDASLRLAAGFSSQRLSSLDR